MTSDTPRAADYLTELADIISRRGIECAEQIGAAAEAIGACVAAGGIIHLFGSGHSRLVAIDAAVRAATMTNAVAICPDEWVGRVERVEGIGEIVLKRSDIRAGEVLVVISQSGLNPLPIEVALGGIAREATVVGVGSAAHSQAGTSRHGSGARLMDIVDVFLDTGVPAGDALFHPAHTAPLGPASTVAASALVHATLVEASRWLVDHGHEPPIRRSRNLPGGAEHNTAVAARYLDRLPELRWM
ncbi:sugar isomerase domain-containing protein [Streptomyces sp. TS71-3]|uniref:sugar isomerase domain-containing protein n=1 Tax=Streptomyces sp. TS71-3 TaxID=2733862 RepID=UPI001B1E9C11|nr:sugar isomerase domain-containing protein [Streptomyces sp. TS71-3]GHJ41911.1 SIS domain-containing protein [Streptomyces sp. TS71-3]